MANGVSLKKREKRTSEARSASSLVGAAAAVEDQRAGLAQLAVGEARGAMQQAHREAGAVAAHEIDVDDLGADLAVAAAAHQEARAVAAHDVVERDRAGLELGEVVAEPVGERRVEILHPALGIGGEEAGGRVVEIVDGALQLEEGVVLPLAVAGDVLDASTAPAACRRPRPRGSARTATRYQTGLLLPPSAPPSPPMSRMSSLAGRPSRAARDSR